LKEDNKYENTKSLGAKIAPSLYGYKYYIRYKNSLDTLYYIIQIDNSILSTSLPTSYTLRTAD
jgi:hypothetical protein